MYQTSMINAVRSWERKLEIEEEQRKNMQVINSEAMQNELLPAQNENSFIFELISKRERKTQPVMYKYSSQKC